MSTRLAVGVAGGHVGVWGSDALVVGVVAGRGGLGCGDAGCQGEGEEGF